MVGCSPQDIESSSICVNLSAQLLSLIVLACIQAQQMARLVTDPSHKVVNNLSLFSLPLCPILSASWHNPHHQQLQYIYTAINCSSRCLQIQAVAKVI